jgi:squalene-hopene/tetraprenyl-beta-curcumene cyclase
VVDGRRAVERALPFLERDGTEWMEGRNRFQGGKGCVSCHHVGFALWSHREAQRAGVPIPAERIRELEKKARASIADPAEGRPVSWSQLLLGREIPAGAGEDWRSFQGHLAAGQHQQGYWEASGQFSSQRRPSRESDAAATMWAMLALASLDQRDDPSLERALAWVRSAPPGVSNEWLVGRLLVERRFGTEPAAGELLRRLIGQQHPDGGWSWLADQPSNAFSTGETLYALRLAGLAPGHPAVRRGTEYLLTSQHPDGTWTVPGGLISGKSSASRDYIYKYWATAWAAIGLARAEPRPEARPASGYPPAPVRAATSSR